MQQFQDDIMKNRLLLLELEKRLTKKIELIEKRLLRLEKSSKKSKK